MEPKKTTTAKPRKKAVQPAETVQSAPEFPMPEIAREFSSMSAAAKTFSKKKSKRIALPFQIKNPGTKTIAALAAVAALIVVCIIALISINWNKESVPAPKEAAVNKAVPVKHAEKKNTAAAASKTAVAVPVKKTAEAAVPAKHAAVAVKPAPAAARTKPVPPAPAAKVYYGRVIDYTPQYVMVKYGRTQYTFYYEAATEFIGAGGAQAVKDAVFVCQMARVSYYIKDKKFFARKVVIVAESDCVK